ncbi:MAG: hypothetical protein MK086_12470 [Flavobacteriales bacterium]|nr:hypothetical protein [Flavobacteriales bacterium]
MKNAFPALLLFFLLSSCVKEKIEIQNFNSSLSPEFGVPLAKATIYAEEVIERYDEDGFVTTDQNGVLTLVYQDTLESITADEYLQIEEQQIDDTYEVGLSEISGLMNFGAVTFEKDAVYQLDFSDDRLDSVRFANGQLTLNLTSNGTIPLSGVMSILDPFSGEAVLTTSFSDENPPIDITVNQDFTNELFRLRSDAEYTNGIRVAFTFELTDNGETYPDEISMSVSFSDFSISSIGGYIAPRVISLDEQSARINIFDEDYGAEVRLEDPRLNLFFNNGFGIGVRPVIDELIGANNQMETLIVPGTQIERLDAVGAATSPGEATLSQLQINNSTMTPSVTDFMAFEPSEVIGRFSLEINPEDDQYNFISVGSSLNVNFEVELPIYGSIANFSLIDTTEINFGDIVESANDFQELHQIDVRLFVVNQLPIEAGVQLIFLDEDLNKIDSLFDAPTTVVPAAPVDLSAQVGSPDYGRVIGETRTTIDVAIPKNRIDDLEDVTQVIVSVFGNTTGNGDNPIRLYPDNNIAVNLAAKANFNPEIE